MVRMKFLSWLWTVAVITFSEQIMLPRSYLRYSVSLDTISFLLTLHIYKMCDYKLRIYKTSS